MRTTIAKPSDRDAWLAARRPFVGASEAAALVGEHPFVTLADLAAEKLTGRPTRADTAAMARGRHLEAGVAAWWEEDHGIALVEPEVLYVYDDALVATLDRRVIGADVAVEIKTTTRYVDELPRSWYWQAQCQCLCADLEHVEVVVLDPRLELTTYTVEPDDEDQQLVAEAAAKFLAHVRAGRIPPDLELTYRAATTLHPEPTTTTTELDVATLRWCSSLRSLQSRIRALQADEDRLKGMIGHALGDAAEGHHDGRTICTWRAVTRRNVDAKRLRAEHPDIAAELTTASSYRQLRLVETKENR